MLQVLSHFYCCNISERFLTLTSHEIVINLVSYPQWLGHLEGRRWVLWWSIPARVVHCARVMYSYSGSAFFTAVSVPSSHFFSSQRDLLGYQNRIFPCIEQGKPGKPCFPAPHFLYLLQLMSPVLKGPPSAGPACSVWRLGESVALSIRWLSFLSLLLRPPGMSPRFLLSSSHPAQLGVRIMTLLRASCAWFPTDASPLEKTQSAPSSQAAGLVPSVHLPLGPGD